MVIQEHLDILKQGVETWNEWRKQHPEIRPDLGEADLSKADLSKADLHEANFYGADLSRAELHEANLSGATLSGATLSGATLRDANLRDTNLHGANLYGANLSEANLSKADLHEANLIEADLHGANLYGANLSEADFSKANLSETDLSGADLSRADLYEATLSEADLSEADLSGAFLWGTDLSRATLSYATLSYASLIGTSLREATLTECHIYGISAWNVQLEGAKQDSLVITPPNEPTVTVDNLKVAQFIYLLLNNKEIRDVIDTITSKVVLILGRFTPERKRVLDALRNELRKKDYLPIVFDFQKTANRDLTETVSTLAHMARFVIADITDPKSIPQELKAIVPNLPSVVIQPLLHARSKEYGMFEHFKSFPWVLEAYRYTTVDRLLASLKEHIIESAEKKVAELAAEKAKRLERS